MKTTQENPLEAFRRKRLVDNQRVLEQGNLGIKRFFTLDTQAYLDGALPSATKELMGLVASAVLRCNDCIDYHLIQCVHLGVKDEELQEALNISLIVGGSIVIPHLRHAFETIEWLRQEGSSSDSSPS